MTCRYCKKFKSVTVASLDYPKGKYKTERICPFKGIVVSRDDEIFQNIETEKGTLKKEYCKGFELDATFYCTEGYTISVEGCVKRHESDEEPQCGKCELKFEILEMKKISFFMQRKREREAKRPKPIVR